MAETVKVYCHKHDKIHGLTIRQAEKLIYQYQYRIAEAATSQPLPKNNPLTETDFVVRNAFCPIDDYKPSGLTPGWKKFIEITVAKKNLLTRMDSQAKHRVRLQNSRRGLPST